MSGKEEETKEIDVFMNAEGGEERRRRKIYGTLKGRSRGLIIFYCYFLCLEGLCGRISSSHPHRISLTIVFHIFIRSASELNRKTKAIKEKYLLVKIWLGSHSATAFRIP